MSCASARYPRSIRLLEAERYRRVFRSCEVKSSDRYITVLAASNHRHHPCLGTAVSKKNVGNAVKRNRIKRVVRESFRCHQAQLEGWDLVVIARHGIAERSNKQLFDALDKHWRKIASHAHTVDRSH